MATEYWLSSSGTGDGSSYANAWGDINDFYAHLNGGSGAKGDILNVINDGVHTMSTAVGITAVTKDLVGTDFDTDPAFTIRGAADQATFSPELATFQGQAAASYLLYVNPTILKKINYVVIKGLYIDFSTVDTGNDASVIVSSDNDAGPYLVQACRIRGYTDSNANYGDGHRIIMDTSIFISPNNWGEISYCVIENCPRPVEWNNYGAQCIATAHNNVFWIKNKWSTVWTNRILFPTVANANHVVGFYNNTLYYDLSDVSGTMADVVAMTLTSGETGDVDWHSNLIWVENASTGTPVITAVFGGSPGSTANHTSGDVSANVVQYGPSIVAGDVTGTYELPWVGGDDEIAYEIADITLFVDPSTPYTWENVNNTGYDLPVPADLRPKLYTTAGLAGILPGALPLGTTDYSVDSVVASDAAPTEGDTITLTATITNTGPQATGVEFTMPLPGGLSYSSDTPSLGTYVAATRVWTIATLDGGASETLAISAIVNAGTAGDTLTTTCAFSTGTPSDNNAANDSSSASVIPVVNDDSTDGGGGDPDDPRTIPYLSVLPFYADILEYSINSSFSLEQNRVRLQYLRYDNELKGFREWASRLIVVEASATDEIITGIETAEIVLLESDEPVQLNAGQTADVFLPDAKVVLLAGGEYSVIKVKNASATDSANTLITVVD